MKPLCYVLIPSGKQTCADGTHVDFDRIFDDVVQPAVSQADLEVYRPSIDTKEWVLSKSLFEQFILSEYALVDLAIAGPSLMYQLGIRQAARPGTTVHLLPGAVEQCRNSVIEPNWRSRECARTSCQPTYSSATPATTTTEFCG